MLARYCGEHDIVSPRGPISPDSPALNYQGLFNPFADIYLEGVSARTVFRRLLKAMRFYNHMTAGQIRRRIGTETWNDFFKFCFERNPWDKVVSHYWYRKKNPRKAPIGSFDEYLDARKCPVDHSLYTINGKLAVDVVGRYENLEADLEKILARIGLTVAPLPTHGNTQYRTNPKPYQEYYDDRTRELVADLYSKEIELFGYCFDS